MQHGRHQNRQLILLRLALPRQPLRQLRFDAFRPNHDPVRLCHGAIPRQSERGSVASHRPQPVNHHNRKLMDGEGNTTIFDLQMAPMPIRLLA